jgi:hypothetical protein
MGTWIEVKIKLISQQINQQQVPSVASVALGLPAVGSIQTHQNQYKTLHFVD